MEILFSWLSSHADYAHYLIFVLLLLSGCSFPISEEIMLLMGGFLASAVIPEHTYHLFLAVFLGCYCSDLIAYGLGRFLGVKLYNVRFLQFVLSKKKQKRLRVFFSRYGFWTLFFGRFIPFGVRNGIFMTAGVGKMDFLTFALIDLSGCFVFSLLLFSLAYVCSQNLESVTYAVHKGNLIIFAAFVIFVVIGGFLMWRKKRNEKQGEVRA